MTFSFEPGKQYADRKGVYEVLSITGKSMRIRYEDGTELDQTVEIKTRIHQNMLSEGRAVHTSEAPEYYRFIGYLAKHGRLEAEVPESSSVNFRNRYRQGTGQDPETQPGYSRISTTNANDKWGAELRIYYPARDGVEFVFPEGVEPKAGTRDGELRINNNSFWHRLVHAGFRMGPHQDSNAIRESIPHQHRQSFDEGNVL